MRALWITRFPPYPPLRGGAFDYSRDLILSLATVGEVRGLAFEAGNLAGRADAHVTWEVLPHHEPAKARSLLSPLPNVAARNVDRALLDRAAALAAECDAVFVDFIAMAWAVAPLRRRLARLAHPPPLVMVTHNHEHAVRRQMARNTASPVMRAALALDAWKAGRLERSANRAADGLTAITVTDRDSFAAAGPTPSIVLPPAYAGPTVPARTIGPATPRVMTILGNRNAHHKMMVLERTLAAFAAAGLDRAARVEIAGEGEFAHLAGRYPGFAFRGYVPDLAQYLADVRLGLLSDDIGGGFKIRAMSYAMLRVPMVALREAMAGMAFEDGVHFVGVDTLDELARAAAALVDDPARLNALQEAAFAFASTRFDPGTTGQRMRAFVDQLRAAPRAGA